MAMSGGEQQWSSRSAFLLASVGFAVGLGNIWRFPYVAGENGGSAFVLVYLGCVFLIGVPILIAELLIGRRGQHSPPQAMAVLAAAEGRSKRWAIVGYMGLLAAYTIEIVYAVVVGWVLWYLFKAVTTGFAGYNADVAESSFAAVLADPTGMLFWTLVGLAFTGYIIYSGVQGGIERAVTILMPMLFALLALLAMYNVFAGGMREALLWLFEPHFERIKPEVFLIAVGQAFFSIGVGMGGMMTFGSYLSKDVSIPGSVLVIVLADTMVALLAGLVIFPAVFYNGLDPAAGAGLIFQTLPVAFANMPGGYAFSVAFFLLLSVAGITSMVGLVESVTSWLEDQHGVHRHKSAILVVGSIAVFSVLSALSYNVIEDYRLFGRNLNDVGDYFSNQLLLPLGGLFIAVFVGWFVSSQSSTEELSIGNPLLFKIWHLLIRWVVPPAVAVIFLAGVVG